jgi:glucose/arabinose dehydrogenase
VASDAPAPRPAATRSGAMRWLLVLADLVALGFFVLAVQRHISIAALLGPGSRAALDVPAGFSASVFAEGLSMPRFMAFGPDGRLYVAESGKNRIVALADANEDGTADSIAEFAADLASPHSVAWHEGALYAGLPNGVVELRDTDGDGKAEARRTVLDDFPTDGHSTRTVLFLDDGRMVVSVGSSCNVCLESDPRRAALVVYDGAGKSGEKVFARGLRNAVGLALHPKTREIWASNNGRDWLGDDSPPETIHVVKQGDDAGWPRCHAGDIVDPDFGAERGCEGVAAPALKMQAHSAPLGLAFYTGADRGSPSSREDVAFPDEYLGNLFVAFHGSWNRSVPTGYKVVRIGFDASGKPLPPADFATGFVDEKENKVRGRPVGVITGPDGALYVSDDKGGFVYRITH